MSLRGPRGTWIKDKCEGAGEVRLMIVLLAAIVRTMDLTLSQALRTTEEKERRFIRRTGVPREQDSIFDRSEAKFSPNDITLFFVSRFPGIWKISVFWRIRLSASKTRQGSSGQPGSKEATEVVVESGIRFTTYKTGRDLITSNRVAVKWNKHWLDSELIKPGVRLSQIKLFRGRNSSDTWPVAPPIKVTSSF